MTTTIKFYTLVLVSFFSNAFTQVGINTTSPTKTLDINGNMRIRQVNTISGSSVLTVDNNGNVYKADGVKLLPAVGEIKYGMQKVDHSGWYMLDGRATATIGSTVARNNAITQFGSVLYDSRNRYIKDTAEAVGTVNGSNSYTLTQSNMPGYTVVGGVTGSSGNHNHTASDNYLASPGNSAARTGTQAGASVNYYFTTASTSATTSTDSWSHNHTASGSTGGGGQAFSIEPMYLTANVFVYLGQ